MDTRLIITIIFVAAVAVNSAVAQSTTAPPLTPNTTVDALSTNISRTSCGTSKLCLSQPTSCDPSSDGSCYFVSAHQISGQNFDFELSGNSTGYIALIVSPDTTVGNNDTTYVCANNNSSVQFFSEVLSNNLLSAANLSVNNVKGRINGSKIQCTFSATVQSVTTKSTTDITIAVLTGEFTNGVLGTPKQQLKLRVADLANATSQAFADVANATTTNHAITFQQSLTQALLIAVGVVRLAML